VGKRYFIAVHTDSGCLLGCDHKHPNVITATACISDPGGYVVAIRRGKMLPLTDAEEAEFQRLMYGQGEPTTSVLDVALMLNGKLTTHG